MAHGHVTLVTGGARSGKSALAERLTLRHGGTPVYIATAEARDTEMAARIDLHRQRRGAGWQVIEEPADLVQALRRSEGAGARLVDCLTLWLANCGEDADIPRLAGTLRAMQSPVVLVTNELGQGIVPANAVARRFRDRHGWMNQTIAAAADQVWMAVSGQPLRLKPGKDDPDEVL